MGAQLVSLLGAAAHLPGDHDAPSSSGAAFGSGGAGGLLAAVNGRCRLLPAIAAAARQGLVALDDAQLDYLAAVMGSSAGGDDAGGDGDAAAAAAAMAAEGAPSAGPDAAVVASLVSQVSGPGL